MGFIVCLIIGIALFVIYVRYLEERSIFYPARDLAVTPAVVGLPFEDVFIQTPDNVTIHGWLVKSKLDSGTLLFFHGNAGNIGDRLEKVFLFHQLGLHVFIIDYRGYGRSGGHPTEAGIYKDAVAAYDYLGTRTDMLKDKIVGYGESLGGAVAIDLATKRGLAALIIDSSFTSAADIARLIYPFIPAPLIRTKLDSLGKIPGITIPKLFIHSRQDELVPFALAERLYLAAAPPKEFLEISGGHNTAFDVSQEKMMRGILTFLRGHHIVE